MAKAKALSKELKQPDEFVSFWTHFGQAITEHRSKVIGAAVVVVVGGGIGWGVSVYRNAQAAKATAAFARIEHVASADLLPGKEPDKADAKGAKPEKKTEDDGLPHFKTAKERIEAAIGEADGFVSRFGQDGLGRKALLGKAGRLIALDRAAEAAPIYESLAASETDAELKLVEQEGAAAANEAAGKLDEALRGYSALADAAQHGDNFYLDRALYAKARVLEKQGKAKDAEQALRDILTKVPKTSLRQQIDDRLAILTEK